MRPNHLKLTTRYTALAALILLAACASDSNSSSPTMEPTAVDPAASVTATASPTPEPMASPTEPMSADLDLREANVLEVEFESLGDRSYRFDVTLLHDDDGEAPSFADKWQVWDTRGNLLGERVLAHSHGTQPFTRSATIEIPEGVSVVLVRGHDMQHGHGGQSMRVDIESGQMSLYEEEG